MRRLAAETHESVFAMRAENEEQLAQLGGQLNVLDTRLIELRSLRESSDTAATAKHRQLVEILRSVASDQENRRRELRRLRAEPEYDLPFSDPDPLISVVIPTYDNHVLLGERSIPSVLAQTYQTFEVIVVGDAAPEEARLAVEEFNDERLRFFNLPYRGPYPDDPATRWRVAGVPAYNEAVQQARGLWIAPLDDDDAFRPHHLERLLERVRRDRLELAYGQQMMRLADGTSTTIGRFPPAHANFGVQSAMYHAGLKKIFECDLTDAALGLPYDWGLCLRMMEAGVRMGMVDEATVDYYPSRSWTPRWEEGEFRPTEEQLEDGTAADGQGERSAPAPEWEYVPEGWARQRDVRGWQVEEVARRYRENWPEFIAATEGSGPLGISYATPIGAAVVRDNILYQGMVLAFAYAAARAIAGGTSRADGSPRLSVLDWGGALGHYRVLAGRLLPETEFDYHCRELPAVCAEGRRLNPDVEFHDNDDCFDRRYDLVVASASLQYAEDWQRSLERLTGAAERWVLVTRVPIVSDHPSLVLLQRAQAYGYATETLGWAFNRGELLDVARGLGLTLDREFVLHPPWPIAGAPAPVSQAGFLFRAAERS